MQIINVADLSDSQLEFADQLLNHKFWQSILQFCVPLIVFVAIWTNVLPLQLDGVPALVGVLFDGLVKAIAVLSGIATFMMAVFCIKAKKEVRQEIHLRQGIQFGGC
ncbi:hypothetical protein LCGC14_0628610 [marine sediment metagenome]|uniref:Uncharacterized protein n=1 Tax=marine sediment metagenome TaxID=412755 RepID=A0A0F9R2M1_9ZZZZ